jgi:archaellum biogenesis ATPase FlaH
MKMKFYNKEEISEILDNYNSEQHTGYCCGLQAVDNIMRLDKGSLVICTARPSDGKSTFLNYYSYLMAKNNAWKTLYISFETTIGRQIKELSTYYNSIDKVAQYSVLMNTNDIKCIEDVYNTIRAAKKQCNIDMVVIDTFTNLQPFVCELNTYTIGNILTKFSQLSKQLDICLILTAHTTKLNKCDEIDAYSICGSANFYNLSDYVFSLKIIDRERYITELKTLKIRENLDKGICGKTVSLQFNPFDKTYSEASEQCTDMPFDAVLKDPQCFDGLPTNTPTNQVLTSSVSKPNEQGEEVQAESETSPTNANKTLLNSMVSVFNINLPKEQQHVKDITLKEALLLGKEYKQQIDNVRSINKLNNENEYKRLKKQLPCFTVSCLCGHGAGDINQYNPIIAIDVDGKDNDKSVEELKSIVTKLPYVTYCAKSVGGKGLFAVIPIKATKETHKESFRALKEEFNNMGIVIDKACNNVNRLRYISYDKEEYYNPQATTYTKQIKIVHHVKDNNTYSKCVLSEKEKERFETAIEDIRNRHLIVTTNHNETLNIASRPSKRRHRIFHIDLRDELVMKI